MDGPPTIADLLRDWLAVQQARLEPSTVASYRGVIERYLVPSLGAVAPRALTAASIERAYSKLLISGGRHGRPLGPRTVVYAHSVLHRALHEAVRLQVLDANPASRLSLPRRRADGTVGPRAQRTWTARELRRFLDWSATDVDAQLWRVAAATGMRRGELLALRSDDLDHERMTVVVRRALAEVGGSVIEKGTKTGRVRTLTLDPTTFAIIHDRTPGLVFPGEHGQLRPPMEVTTRFRALVRRAPVPVIRFHDLRHTHATLLLAAGVPVKVVSERLGHAKVGMTLDVYAHVLPAMDSEAAAQIGALLQG